MESPISSSECSVNNKPCSQLTHNSVWWQATTAVIIIITATTFQGHLVKAVYMKGMCRVPGDVIGTEPWNIPRGSVGKQIGWRSRLGKTVGCEQFSQPSALEEEPTPDHDGLPCHANKGAGLYLQGKRSP